MKKEIFKKTYHGFEDMSDLERDVGEAVSHDYNENIKGISGEFQGRMTVIITYEEDTPAMETPEHAECHDCDALGSIHREGRTHCDCGAEWVFDHCEMQEE